jgi:hypothetical protein
LLQKLTEQHAVGSESTGDEEAGSDEIQRYV